MLNIEDESNKSNTQKKPKIALCLSGLSGGKNDVGRDSGGIDYSFPHFKKHILEKNDVDVFTHSWSVDDKEKILSLFKPKKYIIEKQREFSKILPNIGGEYIDEMQMGKKIRSGELPTSVIDSYNPPKNRKQQCYSQWYSRKKSIDLKREYEEENNFRYDYVMMARFDVLFFTDVIFEKFDNKIFYAPRNTTPFVDNKKPNYNSALIYKENPERITFLENDYRRKGMMDFWFFSNSETMDKFSKLYDNLDYFNQSIRNELNYVPAEMCVVYQLNHIGLAEENIKQVFHRVKDYELVRRWYLDSIY